MNKKLLLIIALLCAVAQGAWAQSVWDGHTTEKPSTSNYFDYYI